MTTPLIKRVMKGVGALAVVYALICIYMWMAQRQLIFVPEQQLQTTPDRNGMRYEEVRIPSGSGDDRGELHGWWIPAQQADIAKSGYSNTPNVVAAPVLLYLHGSSRNISYNAEHAMRLHSLGYSLLLIDYRGYGNSSGGKPSEAKVYQDAEAAWAYLIQQRGIAPQRIFIYGHSLGGAISIDLAVRHPDAAGLIAESTFTSIVALAQRDYPWLPVAQLLNQRFDSIGKVSQLKIPALFIHGTWDKKIPYQMSRQLFDQTPAPKYLTLIDGGEHSNNSGIAWLEYSNAVTTFVQKYTR